MNIFDFFHYFSHPKIGQWVSKLSKKLTEPNRLRQSMLKNLRFLISVKISLLSWSVFTGEFFDKSIWYQQGFSNNLFIRTNTIAKFSQWVIIKCRSFNRCKSRPVTPYLSLRCHIKIIASFFIFLFKFFSSLFQFRIWKNMTLLFKIKK